MNYILRSLLFSLLVTSVAPLYSQSYYDSLSWTERRSFDAATAYKFIAENQWECLATGVGIFTFLGALGYTYVEKKQYDSLKNKYKKAKESYDKNPDGYSFEKQGNQQFTAPLKRYDHPMQSQKIYTDYKEHGYNKSWAPVITAFVGGIDIGETVSLINRFRKFLNKEIDALNAQYENSK